LDAPSTPISPEFTAIYFTKIDRNEIFFLFQKGLKIDSIKKILSFLGKYRQSFSLKL
jgi:hypothetical protein